MVLLNVADRVERRRGRSRGRALRGDVRGQVVHIVEDLGKELVHKVLEFFRLENKLLLVIAQISANIQRRGTIADNYAR